MADSAGTLNCPMCGAAARSDATRCDHCGSRLATVACPSCFGMIFQGSKFCSHCGAAIARQEADLSGLMCPHCETTLKYLQLGKIELAECPKCDGLWLENSQFETVCVDQEQQAVLLGSAVPVPTAVPPMLVKYIKCPVCSVVMNRQNFSGASGVVIDICRPHGTWLDAVELQRIIAFIRGGGMERARERQMHELEVARRRLEAQRSQPQAQHYGYGYEVPHSHGGFSDLLGAIASAVFTITGRKRF